MKVVVISESAFSVQGHGVHTAFTETVNGLEKTSGVAVRVNTFAKADVRHLHTVGPYSLTQLLFGSGRKVISAHVVPESFIGSLVGAKYWLPLARVYLRWFYNRADAVIAVSDKTKQDLIKIGVKAPISVIYNMVDIGRYDAAEIDKSVLRKKYDIPERAFVVVGNGQVQPRKRIDSFIRLAKELPDYFFVWVGGMPFKHAAADYQKMKQLMDSAPDNVRFTGVIDHAEVKDYFHISDAFILPSDQETFGLAVVEAAASGLPVVLRDIADYQTTFRDYAVMCDESEFSSALRRLQTDQAYYQQMKQSAALLAERFDSATIVQQLLATYRS